MSKEHPLLFDGEMVRAILSGAKTQTRRPVKPQPETYEGQSGLQFELPGWHGSLGAEKFAREYCPFGVPGDALWVREAFCIEQGDDFDAMCLYAATDQKPDDAKWRPSIHMPRSLCRLLLRVKRVWVERVQKISEADAIAEGVDAIPSAPAALNHRTSYAGLWDAIYSPTPLGWDKNPWVWAYEFERMETT